MGLKQAPHAWSDKISKYLMSIGFSIGTLDSSLFMKKIERGIVVIVIYVDDLIVIGDFGKDIAKVKEMLCAKFDMKDLGDLRYFLGVEVVTRKDGIWLVQRHYALEMLAKYGMTAGSKPISMPLEQNVKLRAILGDELGMMLQCTEKWFGSLIYLIITRSDLSYIVGLVSHFMQSPRKPHLDVVRRIMRYVKATAHYGLFYAHGKELDVHGYIDADWVGSSYDRRSTSGYAFTFENVVVSWSTTIVALSSTETKYRGATLVVCDVMWLKKLLTDLGEHCDGKVIMYYDNMSSMQLASNPVYHKHIEVHYHYV